MLISGHIWERRGLTFRTDILFGQRNGVSNRKAPASKRESPPASSHQRFFFVDAKSSSKGKRSHVMKHHIREKKKGQSKLLAREPSTQSPGRPSRILPWTRRAAQRISELDDLATPGISQAPPPSSSVVSQSFMVVLSLTKMRLMFCLEIGERQSDWSGSS